MTIRFVVSAAALVGLTACGGGGGNLGGASFSQLDNDYTSLEMNTPFTETPALPSGDAGYAGAMLIAQDLDPAGGGTSSNGYLGQVTILMDFDTGDFDGSAGNFYDVNLDTGTGNPTSSNGGVLGSADFDAASVATAAFTTSMSGTIDGQTLAGTGDGLFRGTGATHVTIFDDEYGDVTLDGSSVNIAIYAD